MERFAKTGDFCPHPDCKDYGKRQDAKQKNIQKYGKTIRCEQRYQCCTCKHTFTATTGTIFYGKHTTEDEILETLALLAEGSRISSLSRVKGYKEDTILSWLRDAREHLEAVEEALLKNYRVTRGQLDAMWGYVGNKGEKNYPETAESGQYWRSTYLDRDTRLRVARGIDKNETLASIKVYETLKRRGHPDGPPPTISDGVSTSSTTVGRH